MKLDSPYRRRGGVIIWLSVTFAILSFADLVSSTGVQAPLSAVAVPIGKQFLAENDPKVGSQKAGLACLPYKNIRFSEIADQFPDKINIQAPSSFSASPEAEIVYFEIKHCLNRYGFGGHVTGRGELALKLRVGNEEGAARCVVINIREKNITIAQLLNRVLEKSYNIENCS